MKTKLEKKFEKQSKPYIRELRAIERKYEKFLKEFIKREIVGIKNYKNRLGDEINFQRYCCGEWNQEDLLATFSKPRDFLEIFINSQIFSLTYDAHVPPDEGGPIAFALARERE